MPDPIVYVDPPPLEVGDAVRPSDDDDHHLRTVLRLGPGDRIVVGDGRGGLWPAELAPDGDVVVTGPPERTAPHRPRLRVLQALPKGRKLDDIVRMLVELGVERISPVSSARTVRELDGRKRERELGRWRSVARAAASQSRRPWLATVDPLADPERAVVGIEAGIVPHVGSSVGLGDVAEGLRRFSSVAVAIGPEGGWTDEEVTRFEEAGLTAVSLGDTVLRTEHAAFAACAALAFAFGRMDPRVNVD